MKLTEIGYCERWLVITWFEASVLTVSGRDRTYNFLSCAYKLYSCMCRLNALKPSMRMSLGLDWWLPCDGRSIHWHPSRWGYIFFIEYSDTHVSKCCV